MGEAQFFLQIAIILIVARIFAEIAMSFGAPSVIGELFAGIALGPSLAGIIEPNDVIHLLAMIGVILLLFEVGLETDVERLAKSGRQSTIAAIGGFVTPFVLGWALSYLVFDQSMVVSLFIGGALTATSIGITVRILRDVGRQNSLEGQIVLGAAVIDDVLGVLLLAFLYEYSQSGDLSLTNLTRIALFTGMFFVLAPIAAKAVSQIISSYEKHAHTPGLIATIIVSLVLLFAAAAHAVGAPELLGGFAAGLALSRRFFLPFGVALGRNPVFAEHVEVTMKPIVQLFTPIFFVTVGLSLDLTAIDWSSGWIWTFSLSLAFFAIIGKIAGGFMLRKQHWLMRSAVGLSMVPRGEVGLIFAELGRSAGVFDPATYAAMVLVIAYTTLFSPFWIKLFYRLYGSRAELSDNDAAQHSGTVSDGEHLEKQ
jgi:Kef-type K+ transport system membrane component KefB